MYLEGARWGTQKIGFVRWATRREGNWNTCHSPVKNNKKNNTEIKCSFPRAAASRAEAKKWRGDWDTAREKKKNDGRPENPVTNTFPLKTTSGNLPGAVKTRVPAKQANIFYFLFDAVNGKSNEKRKNRINTVKSIYLYFWKRHPICSIYSLELWNLFLLFNYFFLIFTFLVFRFTAQP